jgi:hypothetical protein
MLERGRAAGDHGADKRRDFDIVDADFEERKQVSGQTIPQGAIRILQMCVQIPHVQSAELGWEGPCIREFSVY